MPIYDKPVHQLMKDMVTEMKLGPGQVLTREQVVGWFENKYPKVKEGTVTSHLIRLSMNNAKRFHWSVKPGDDIFFQLGPGRYRLYDPRTDPAPLVEGEKSLAVPLQQEDEAGEAGTEFAYEHDLRDYLAKNLHLIEPGLKLYQQEDVSGIEFPAGGRYIDLLAVDTSNNYVVIELKVSRGYDRVVGQLLRYVSWIRKHHADPGQKVRGVIIGREITEDLRLACCDLLDVKLYEYVMSVALKSVTAEA